MSGSTGLSLPRGLYSSQNTRKRDGDSEAGWEDAVDLDLGPSECGRRALAAV